ncbi:MAG: hypothetical protein L0387_31705 [Acidobacteria bacterium]|nr:hypothetical protein [Acidobacteriota bacterium]MCI0626160.1 hypothetical protein [Acidobacteriota bacterium]MCI0718726.1 hypothetical protein [Acidobacteriota bacterium]
MGHRTYLKLATVLGLGALLMARPAFGQGCVCQKQGSPLFGGISPYMSKGEWQLLLYYRGYESDKHFQGRNAFTALDANGPLNRQNFFNIDLTYAASRKWNFSLSVPVHFNSFSVRRQAPGSQERVWVPIRSNGIGDAGLRARYWIFNTENTRHNVGVTAGLKMPTGKANVTDDYFGRQVPVDVSVQPGDKSWAGTTGVYAFQQVGLVTLFASGSYLFNPRNTTGVPTFFGSLTNPNNTTYNSASDQFSTQMGGSLQLKPGWPVPSLVYRIEGVPVYDLFGASDGFRRPGTIGFVEPGVNFALGRHLFGVSLGIRSYVNVKDAPNSVRVEDATVPKLIFTAGYSVRF